MTVCTCCLPRAVSVLSPLLLHLSPAARSTRRAATAGLARAASDSDGALRLAADPPSSLLRGSEVRPNERGGRPHGIWADARRRAGENGKRNGLCGRGTQERWIAFGGLRSSQCLLVTLLTYENVSPLQSVNISTREIDQLNSWKIKHQGIQ